MAERRRSGKLAVILHADIAGSTTLVQQDEDVAHERIQDSFRRFSDTITKYHGQMRELRGDALLAEFERASDAVPAALAFQADQDDHNAQLNDHIQPKLRVGIAMGEVIVADDTVTGAGVVLAQRVEQLAEPGGVCITGAIHEALPQRMPFVQANLGEQQVKGFDDPVHVYRVELKSGESIPPPQEYGQRETSATRRGLIAAVAVIALVAIGGAAYWFKSWAPEEEPASVKRMAFPLPEKPSIAVLPFSNLSGDPDQEYLADGLTEEIITTLSKSPNLFVIARNSTFTYKGKPIEVKQVAEEQGVRYVLEGSVQLSGDRIRINAQLIDALEGHHIWAERYDREFNDIFALQDDITQNILIALEVELTQGEEVRLMHARAPDPEAFLYLQKSRVHYYRQNKQDNAIARELATKATEISPEYPDAWEWMGWYHFNDYRFGWGVDRQESFKQAEAVAQKAHKLDPTVSGVNGLLGALSLYRGDYDQAIAHYRKAVELAPSNAIMIGGLAWVLVYSGYPKEAIPLLQQAMRLSPYYPAWIVGTLGLAYMMTGDYPKAIAANQQMIERKSLLQFGYSRMAAIHAVLGDDERAKAYAAELLKINPDFNLSNWSKVLIYRDQEVLDWELSALRKAGLPENPPLKLPDKPSIAVLPFTNMSTDPEHEYFVDGMTEDLITDLSKISGLFVIARNSSFTYKGKPVDVKNVARDLGVRYVMEGSVRRAGNQVRINAQLIDATTGGHVWAERYDGTLENVFGLQDQVTQQIVNALAVNLTSTEKVEHGQKETDIPQAYDAFLRGWEHYQRRTPDHYAKARDYFEQAIELDPDYSRAYAALASIYWRSFYDGWAVALKTDADTAKVRAQEYIETAMQRPTPLAHQVAAWSYLWRGRYEEALGEAEQAIVLDVNDADSHSVLAEMLIFAGRPEEALDAIRRARRLDPHNEAQHSYLSGLVEFGLDQFEAAAASIERALDLNPELLSFEKEFGSSYCRPCTPLAATYAYLGREADAREIVRDIKKSWPNAMVGMAMFEWPFKRAVDRDRLAEGLRKAGMPNSYSEM